MPQTVGKLNALKVSRSLDPGMYPDGAGLYLQVTGAGAKSWLYRYQRDGKEHQMGLGSLSAVSLADARRKAAEARRLRAEGVDPIRARNASQATKNPPTFKDCGEAYIAAHKAGWGSKSHQQWTTTFETYVYPTFGDSPIPEVDTDMVLKALEPIWRTKTVTASRVRGRIESVLDWAKVKGYRAGDNPARWRGHLDHLLPAVSKVHKVENHTALPHEGIPEFMAKLRKRGKSSTASALEFCILTATRSTETLGATAREIDLANAVWTIPAERMKIGVAHRIPLVGRALEIAKEAANGGLLFPGEGADGLLDKNAMLELLMKMRIPATVHGFRSAFDDWASETTDHAPHIIDMALAHKIPDATRAAYRRGDLFTKRRALMADWDAYCSSARQDRA
jgi:integrase